LQMEQAGLGLGQSDTSEKLKNVHVVVWTQLSTPDWIGRFSGRIEERPKCSCVLISIDIHRSVMLIVR
jgi:hypothetical protein